MGRGESAPPPQENIKPGLIELSPSSDHRAAGFKVSLTDSGDSGGLTFPQIRSDGVEEGHWGLTLKGGA